jgi:hypothetical protein
MARNDMWGCVEINIAIVSGKYLLLFDTSYLYSYSQDASLFYDQSSPKSSPRDSSALPEAVIQSAEQRTPSASPPSTARSKKEKQTTTARNTNLQTQNKEFMHTSRSIRRVLGLISPVAQLSLCIRGSRIWQVFMCGMM